jgi:hypothetical protein
VNTSEYTKTTMDGGQTIAKLSGLEECMVFDIERSGHHSRAHSSAQGMGPLL